MKKLKSLLVTLVMLLCTISASAHDFVVDGIYYNITSSSDLTVEVTLRNYSYSSYPDRYTGNVVIPETVIYNNKTYSVTSIGYSAFHGCSDLTSVTIPNSVTSIGDDAFRYCSRLNSVTIPNSVTWIKSEAFRGCTSLTSVTIPNSDLVIGKEAFLDCTSISSVHISDIAAWCNIEFFDVSSNPLYYAKHLYMNGKEITELVIPDGVTSIGDYAFYECSSLTSVTIPNSVTSIGNAAFHWCPGLTSLHISDIAAWCNIDFFDYTSNPLRWARHFYIDGKEVTKLIIPDGVTSIGEYAFEHCDSLTSVTIPNSVTTIGESAFYGCSNLSSVTLGNGVTSIGDYAFYHCHNLTSVFIPNSVTGIGENAFYKCSSLVSIILGKNVKSISSEAFRDCDKLEDVYCLAEKAPKAEQNAFDGSYPDYAVLHVPVKSIKYYKSTAPWSSFGLIVEMSDGDEPLIQAPDKCSTPTISYINGKLVFDCKTEGVEYVTDITNTDIMKHYGSEINLTATYNICVYAKKDGYKSEVAKATLCWIDVEPKSEGLTNTDIANVKALPVVVQANNGTITVTGADDGTMVEVYGISGTKLGEAKTAFNTATIHTDAQTGSVVIVKVGNKAIKIKI